MAKQNDFNKFISNIEPSKSTKRYISSVQTNLRDYLKSHDNYKDVHDRTFLSGSYAKHTSVRPTLFDGKRDVDIVVVTSYNEKSDSQDVINELYDILIEKEKYKKATIQSHSVGVEMGGIEIDIVPVIKNENSDNHLIGTSNINQWEETDPEGHIEWSTDINIENDSAYKPLVKIIKWWRRNNCPTNIKYPKGLALEVIVANNLGNCDLSIEDYLITCFENIVDAYSDDIINKRVPYLQDPCIENNNLLRNFSFNDFHEFIKKIQEHLTLLGEKGTANAIWQEILGDEFPSGNDENASQYTGDFNNPLTVQHKQRPLWTGPMGNAVIIRGKIDLQDGRLFSIESDGPSLPKGCGLTFTAFHSTQKDYSVKWQIVNTGEEATMKGNLRGGFEESKPNPNIKIESTEYKGAHSIQCYVIKKGQCVAKSKEFIVNIE